MKLKDMIQNSDISLKDIDSDLSLKDMIQDSDLDLEFKEIADPRQLTLLNNIYSKLGDVVSSVGKIKLDVPRVFKVFGTVSVDQVGKLPPVKIQNLGDLHPYFVMLAQQVDNMDKNLSKAVGGINLTIPNKKEGAPKELSIKNFSTLLDDMEELKKGFNALINKESAVIGFPEKSIPVEIQNWMIPQPVNSMNINPLQGFVKTTTNTVSTSRVALPGYGQLFNRRSLMIYNNSANTIYIGGSDVTAANGLPVPASSYSPSIDAGYNLIVYGIASTGNNDVRVIEVSKDKEADVQG